LKETLLKTKTNTTAARSLPLLFASALALTACGGSSDDSPAPAPAPAPAPVASNTLPSGVVQLSVANYSATAVGTGTTAATQDLLTGGLGKTGLGAAAAPAYADPLNPTALEIRRNALYSNYRGILDASANGGYGTLYGPNVTAAGTITTGEGLIPGREYVAYLDDGSGNKKVTMAVQIPDSFSQANPCIVLGPSSGSRGVYGAIGSAGEWGLKKGCAVAYTDAGKGVGFHDLADDTVTKIDGTRATRAAAGTLSHFAANISEAARVAFNTAFPNRWAIKQVHSQLNPEKDWGTDTLVSARYALWALNDRFGTPGTAPTPFSAANTLVIAGSVSNGGAAVIRAAEIDGDGLIDGVVASEPLTQMPGSVGYGIVVGGNPTLGYGKSLADFTTWGNLYQPCAALAPIATPAEAASFFNFMTLTAMTTRAQARCAGLAAKGLVTGATVAAQATDALNKLRSYGWTPDHDQMHNAHWGLGNGAILSAMYPTGYGRFSVTENVCNTSFASVNATGDVVAAPAATKAQSFAVGNGTANGSPITPVYNASVGGAKSWALAVSPSTGVADFGLDQALCQRALVTGTDPVTGAALTAASTPTAAQSAAVRAGIDEVKVTGNLRGKPTIIVAGRSDALVVLNNNSRAYAALNRGVEGAASKVSYIEVTNAQHFDTFLTLSGWDTRFVPLHQYYNQAMDAMYNHLKNGGALPGSQVVRTTPRGGVPGAAPAITAANVPALVTTPAAGNAITFSGSNIQIPN
jgi:hydroxybutyrate-dimer hydrolase